MEYFQHETIRYSKADGSKCSKSELVKKEANFQSLIDLLESRVFLDKNQFLVHCLRKLLAGQMRKELRNNLALTDVISYIDFSKGRDSLFLY